MADFGVSIRVLDSFFDREKVIRAMDRWTRNALSEAGRAVRKNALASIRRAPMNVNADPGQPPFDHTGYARELKRKQAKRAGQKLAKAKAADKGLKAILYGYVAASQSVVIGPLRFGGKAGSSTVPAVLEFGGVSRNYRGQPVRIKPHPFMRPALERELPQLPQRWSSSVHT